MNVFFIKRGEWRESSQETWAPRVTMTGFCSYSHPAAPAYAAHGLHLCLVLSGRMRLMTDDKRIVVAGQGTLVVYHPGWIRYQVVRGEPLTFYQAHIELGPTSPGEDGLIPVIDGGKRLPRLTDVSERLRDYIDVFERLSHNLINANPLSETRTKAAGLELLAMAFESAHSLNVSSRRPEDEWDKILTFMENLNADMPLSELSAKFGMTANTFHRKFVERAAIPPKQYLLRRRLWKARRLLSAGRSVKETALSVGFKDQLYFSRIFKKHIGVSPSHFKQDVDGMFSLIDEVKFPVNRLLFAEGIDFKYFRPTEFMDKIGPSLSS